MDADPELKLSYEDLRLRVVNDPVGQCVVVELLLRLFVLHILGASPDCVAQPEGVSVEHRVWTSDGVAASLRPLDVWQYYRPPEENWKRRGGVPCMGTGNYGV